MNDVSYWVAFTSGLVSFFTPCILPLLPVYFGYLAGEAMDQLSDGKVHRKLIVNALAFVFGISVVNLLLGFGAKAASNFLIKYSVHLRVFGGILLILFGLYFILGLRLGFIEKERKFNYKSYSPTFLKSFLLGLTFSFGWTPCNGPIIASILFMASFKQDYFQAGTLMLTYSLGFSILFLLSAILVGVFIEKIKKVYRYFKYIKWVAGLLMIGMGILMLTNRVSLLAF
jgi:cytochrome c-type biogenesis protein